MWESWRYGKILQLRTPFLFADCFDKPHTHTERERERERERLKLVLIKNIMQTDNLGKSRREYVTNVPILLWILKEDIYFPSSTPSALPLPYTFLHEWQEHILHAMKRSFVSIMPLLILQIATVLSVFTNYQQHYDIRRSGFNLSLLARWLTCMIKSKQTVITKIFWETI